MNQSAPKRILVLSSAEPENPDRMELNDTFIGNLQERLGEDIKIEWHNYHDICIEFASGVLEVTLRSSGEHLNGFDFVYIKSYFRFSEFAGAVVSYLDHNHVKFVCTELRNHISLSKLTQFTRLALNNMPIAHTVFMLTPGFLESYDSVAQKLGTPFIFKAIDGSGGDENFLIHDRQQFVEAINKHPDLKFVAQSFIENDSDLRVLIVGGEIKLVIKRQRKDNSTHLNNTSQGADAFILPLDQLAPEHQQLSLKAAEIMEREVAGVDLLFQSGTGKPYILEVNASPQIASGAFEEEKLDIYSNYFKNMVQ